ncbi:MAG TPA: hypothetical protein VLE53_00530 [Gemmatimonadaceae bacterium]|nr:hypothetical protein [Gemmatimonadaceae bacterium]
MLTDAAKEIRIVALQATRGVNYWSRRPVIRMDLRVGAFEEISSAEVPGFTESLVRVMPGLLEHQCSIGAPGGFLLRLRRGTYAPHIIEHVALELQQMIGVNVGFGRTRGGDQAGEYTLVFEHHHEHVGMRAAALALEIVQRAFGGALWSIDASLDELRTLLGTPDAPPVAAHVWGAVTGGAHRAEAQADLRRRLGAVGGEENGDGIVVDVSPAYLLQVGLPYRTSDLAIVLDTELSDVPERYRAPDRARRLVSIVADAVPGDGVVVCPAGEWEIQDYARERQCRVAIFAGDDSVSRRDARVAMAVGRVRDGRILVERYADVRDCGPLDPTRPAAPQVAAALGAWVMARDGGGDRGAS